MINNNNTYSENQVLKFMDHIESVNDKFNIGFDEFQRKSLKDLVKRPQDPTIKNFIKFPSIFGEQYLSGLKKGLMNWV